MCVHINRQTFRINMFNMILFTKYTEIIRMTFLSIKKKTNKDNKIHNGQSSHFIILVMNIVKNIRT